MQADPVDRVSARNLDGGRWTVPRLSFGCGPVSGLWQSDAVDRQIETVSAALAAGIDWFDVAPTYGGGVAEANLGRCIRQLADVAQGIRFASKVRIETASAASIADQAKRTVAGSLERLGVERLALLQVHNAVTTIAGSQPDSIAPRDAVRLLEAMQALQREGMVERLGLTGLGDAGALAELLSIGGMDAVQTPYHLLNPSGGQPVRTDFAETDYERIIDRCAAAGVGVFAIRVFAGGALANRPPSAHTLSTKYFPLDLYERDRQAARRLREHLPAGLALEEAAIRFSLGHEGVASAIVGFGSPEDVRAAVRWANAGPLPEAVIEKLRTTWERPT